MSKKFFVATFGCRTNQADSAALRQDFLSHGFEETDRCPEAEVVVINSCTVTHRSDQQVRQLTRRLRRENPSARLVVTGCYAQRAPQRLARIPGVDVVVGNSHKDQLVELATGPPLSPGTPTRREIAAIYQDDFRAARAMDVTPALQTGGRTRPFVKIQDGCDAKCTYCIIPQVRGPSRSVPPELILQQVRELVESGFKEIVLTGIHIGTYGMHARPRFPLDRLLSEIVSVPGLEQIRLSSIEPMQLSHRIIDLAASCDRIAQHFHICLQSGSDRILGKMRRPYNTCRFAGIVRRIRERMPHAGIGTDVIVGFPGESEDDHRQTVEFIQRMPFTYLHVFPYSDRSGTPASRMGEKVEPRLIRRRSEELRRISEQKNRAFAQGFIGRRVPALTLTEEKDSLREAITGNYLKARVDLSVPPNRIVTGTAAAYRDGYLLLNTS